MQSMSVSVREKGRPAHAMRACSREAWRQPGLFERAHSRATGLQKCADGRRRAGLWAVEASTFAVPAQRRNGGRSWRRGVLAFPAWLLSSWRLTEGLQAGLSTARNELALPFCPPNFERFTVTLLR